MVSVDIRVLFVCFPAAVSGATPHHPCRQASGCFLLVCHKFTLSLHLFDSLRHALPFAKINALILSS
jgi:hypothetical protein